MCGAGATQQPQTGPVAGVSKVENARELRSLVANMGVDFPFTITDPITQDTGIFDRLTTDEVRMYDGVVALLKLGGPAAEPETFTEGVQHLVALYGEDHPLTVLAVAIATLGYATEVLKDQRDSEKKLVAVLSDTLVEQGIELRQLLEGVDTYIVSDHDADLENARQRAQDWIDARV